MVCAESLCCGTCVVGFEAGGPELISLPQYSRFVSQGNLDALEAAVKDRLNDLPDKKQVRSGAERAYALERMRKEYLDCYRGM